MSDQTTDQPYKPESETPMNWPREPTVQAVNGKVNLQDQ
jgi:hypothetical protein